MISKLLITIILILRAVSLYISFPISNDDNSQKIQEEIEMPSVMNDEYKVMSFNIKFFNLFINDNWLARKDVAVKHIRNADPDIIGFQEVVSGFQRYTLRHDLKDKYTEIFYGRLTYYFGEGTPIYYKTDKFDLLDKGFFWLSETPWKLSTLEGMSIPRICIYAHLKDKVTGKEIAYYNTHLPYDKSDHKEAMEVILNYMDTFNYSDDTLLLVGGDFNSFRDMGANNLLIDNGYIDTGTSALDKVEGDTFKIKRDGVTRTFRMDYIYSKNQENVSFYRIFNHRINKYYASNHYAIMIGIK